MLLTIDISNTSIKAGIFEKSELLADWRIATERHKLADDYGMLFRGLLESKGLSGTHLSGVAISCVVPPLRREFLQLSRDYLHRSPLFVEPGVKTGVRLLVDHPSEVGADRIVNVAATHRLYGGPAISIALGTATVFDCISKDGDYLGGAIAPGMLTALESLTRSAAQLYQVDLRRPKNIIGKNTVETMQSGLVLGYAGLIEGLVSRLSQEMREGGAGEDIKVVATGGLAEVVAPETKAIQVVDQELTLQGLRLIYEMNQVEVSPA